MNAILSGHAGVALLVEEAWIASIHVGTADLIPRRPEEIPDLFGGARDLEFMDNIEISEVARELEIARARTDALHLAVITLDGTLSEKTRRSAARALDSMIIQGEILEFLEKIFYAVPLPSSADVHGAIQCCINNSATAKFIEGLLSLQSIITRVHKHWNRDPIRAYETRREREAARGLAARKGVLRELVLQAQTPPPTEPHPYSYDRTFDRAEKSVEALLTTSPGAEDPEPLLTYLKSLSMELQVQEVESLRLNIYNSRLVHRMVDLSHASRYRNGEEMLHWATLAKTCATLSTAEAVGSEAGLADLRTRAWGQYGNALRIYGKPREAEAALVTAQHFRQSGTGDPLLRAWLLEKMSSLSIFQGNFSEAIEMCEEAEEVYRELGEHHLLAGTLVQKAVANLYSGETEQAARILNQAISLIDVGDLHLLITACHNLIRCYIDLDRPDQALALYSEIRTLYQELDDPLILLRMAWQEGILLRDLGHLRAAETALLRARKGYLEKGLSYEVALTSLDLVTVYVKLGLVDEVKRTVMTTVPIFHALRVKLEALAALLQLQKVADQEQEALELTRMLNEQIQALRQLRLEEK